jgi:metal-responsive CopG/Arc/MetJ family transcriptional regulator
MPKGGVSLYVYLPNSLYKKVLERIGDKSASSFIQIAVREYLEDKDRNLVREVVRAGMYEIYNQVQQLKTLDYSFYVEFIKICKYVLEQEASNDKKKKELQ